MPRGLSHELPRVNSMERALHCGRAEYLPPRALALRGSLMFPCDSKAGFLSGWRSELRRVAWSKSGTAVASSAWVYRFLGIWCHLVTELIWDTDALRTFNKMYQTLYFYLRV